MSSPESLQEVYADEMKDLWSANDQMSKVLKTMAGKAHDPKLKEMLEESMSGIATHSQTLQGLLEEAGGEVEKEHCKGMEGLAREATKHITREKPETDELTDVTIISQYQRMSHYGLAGFGTAAAYAGALAMNSHVEKLKSIVADIYKGDKYASKLGEKLAKVAAKSA